MAESLRGGEAPHRLGSVWIRLLLGRRRVAAAPLSPKNLHVASSPAARPAVAPSKTRIIVGELHGWQRNMGDSLEHAGAGRECAAVYHVSAAIPLTDTNEESEQQDGSIHGLVYIDGMHTVQNSVPPRDVSYTR